MSGTSCWLWIYCVYVCFSWLVRPPAPCSCGQELLEKAKLINALGPFIRGNQSHIELLKYSTAFCDSCAASSLSADIIRLLHGFFYWLSLRIHTYFFCSGSVFALRDVHSSIFCLSNVNLMRVLQTKGV
jgi:hypothetical protein